MNELNVKSPDRESKNAHEVHELFIKCICRR